MQTDFQLAGFEDDMRISAWIVWSGLVVITLCSSCNTPGDPPDPFQDRAPVHKSVANQIAESEITAVSISSHRGDIDVLALATGGTHYSLFEDNLSPDDDITETVKVIDHTAWITLSHRLNAGGPPAQSFVHIPPGTDLKVSAENGNIHVSGPVNTVNAIAQNGSIEVRGSATSMDLKTQGNDHDIVVDVSGPSQLKLHADSGGIHIMAEEVTVEEAQTNHGSIWFSGALRPGTPTQPVTHTFNANDPGEITLVVPYNSTYGFDLITRDNMIMADLPINPLPERHSYICGHIKTETLISLEVYPIPASSKEKLSHLAINQGIRHYTDTITVAGMVQGESLNFESTLGYLRAILPVPADLCISHSTANIAGGATVLAPGASQAADSSVIESFKNYDQTPAAPGAPAVANKAVVTGTVGQGYLCPSLSPPPLLITAHSNGGRIRILQSVPFD